MLTILFLTWLVIQLIGAIRSKDTLIVVVAIVGIVLALLVCVGAIALPLCLRGTL